MNHLYVVATWVSRRETIVVGSLGPVTFTRGWYAYVGSAGRGREARVARHMCAQKPLRWHADYLFSPHPATRSWPIDTELTECELAAELRRGVSQIGQRDGGTGMCAHSAELAAAGFGASDCGCGGHLVAVEVRSDLDRALRDLTAPRS